MSEKTDYVKLNNVVGKINAPKKFLENWTKEREDQLVKTFLLFKEVQPNEKLAWGIAVNEKISQWKGLINIIK